MIEIDPSQLRVYQITNTSELSSSDLPFSFEYFYFFLKTEKFHPIFIPLLFFVFEGFSAGRVTGFLDENLLICNF